MNEQPEQSADPRPGSLYYKPLDDGHEVSVYPQTFGRARVCFGRQNAPDIITAYDYEDPGLAIAAGVLWDGAGDPIDGWCRHADTGRRREHGNPFKETVEWIPAREIRWVAESELLVGPLPCFADRQHPAAVAFFELPRENEEPRRIRAVHCAICDKAWVLLHRRDDTVGIAELDLTGWVML